MFQLNMRGHFPVRVTKHWNRLARELVVSPSLEIVRTCLDTILHNVLWVILLSSGVRLEDLQRSLPTLFILWFCDLQLRVRTLFVQNQSNRTFTRVKELIVNVYFERTMYLNLGQIVSRVHIWVPSFLTSYPNARGMLIKCTEPRIKPSRKQNSKAKLN